MFVPMAPFVWIAKKVAPDLVKWVQKLTLTQRYKLLAHVLLPTFILGTAFLSGGWVAIGYEREVTISELRTESPGTGGSLTRRGVVIIAEPVSSKLDYLIPVTNNTSKIWSSLDPNSADENLKKFRLALNATHLHGNNPIVTPLDEPIVLVVEGDLGKEIELPGYANESVEAWRLSPKRSFSLVIGVIVNCALALGIGVVSGFPFVDPSEDNAGQVGAEPDKK